MNQSTTCFNRLHVSRSASKLPNDSHSNNSSKQSTFNLRIGDVNRSVAAAAACRIRLGPAAEFPMSNRTFLQLQYLRNSFLMRRFKQMVLVVVNSENFGENAMKIQYKWMQKNFQKWMRNVMWTTDFKRRRSHYFSIVILKRTNFEQ